MNKRRCAMPGNQAVTVHCSSKNSDPSGFTELKKSSLSFYQMQQMGLLLGQKFTIQFLKIFWTRFAQPQSWLRLFSIINFGYVTQAFSLLWLGSFIFPKTLFLLGSLPFLYRRSQVLLCNENHLLFNIWQHHDNNNNFKFIKMNEFLNVYIIFFLTMWETDTRLGYQWLAYLLHIISLYTSLLLKCPTTTH